MKAVLSNYFNPDIQTKYLLITMSHFCEAKKPRKTFPIKLKVLQRVIKLFCFVRIVGKNTFNINGSLLRCQRSRGTLYYLRKE